MTYREPILALGGVIGAFTGMLVGLVIAVLTTMAVSDTQPLALIWIFLMALAFASLTVGGSALGRIAAGFIYDRLHKEVQ